MQDQKPFPALVACGSGVPLKGEANTLRIYFVFTPYLLCIYFLSLCIVTYCRPFSIQVMQQQSTSFINFHNSEISPAPTFLLTSFINPHVQAEALFFVCFKCNNGSAFYCCTVTSLTWLAVDIHVWQIG